MTEKYDFCSVYRALSSFSVTDGIKSIYVRVALIKRFQMIPNSALYDDFWSRYMRSRYENPVKFKEFRVLAAIVEDCYNLLTSGYALPIQFFDGIK